MSQRIRQNLIKKHCERIFNSSLTLKNALLNLQNSQNFSQIISDLVMCDLDDTLWKRDKNAKFLMKNLQSLYRLHVPLGYISNKNSIDVFFNFVEYTWNIKSQTFSRKRFIKTIRTKKYRYKNKQQLKSTNIEKSAKQNVIQILQKIKTHGDFITNIYTVDSYKNFITKNLEDLYNLLENTISINNIKNAIVSLNNFELYDSEENIHDKKEVVISVLSKIIQMNYYMIPPLKKASEIMSGIYFHDNTNIRTYYLFFCGCFVKMYTKFSDSLLDFILLNLVKLNLEVNVFFNFASKLTNVLLKKITPSIRLPKYSKILYQLILMKAGEKTKKIIKGRGRILMETYEAFNLIKNI